MAYTVNPSLFGLIVSGDLADQTIYTDRHGRKVAYKKSPPKAPPTDLQLGVRNRFMEAQVAYMALSPLNKQSWETLVRRANLCMTGQNLFIHVAMLHTFEMLATVILQTGVDVDAPDPV